MKNIAFVYPGVGSQHTGMGKEFYTQYPVVRSVVDEASDFLGTNLYKRWQDQSYREKMNDLNFAQISLLTLSFASYQLLKEETSLQPDFMIGHSLGEYSALCCDGIIEFSDALQLVQQRGKFIEEAASGQKGTMLWVIDLDTKIVEEVCKSLREQQVFVYISSYDSSLQCGISCLEKDIPIIAQTLEARDAIVYPLNLSGPFHSPLMMEASEALGQVLDGYEFKTLNNNRVIANGTGLPYTNNVKEHLKSQLISPVFWFQSLAYLEQQGVTTIVEIGPKEVLKYLVVKGGKPFQTFSFNKPEHVEELGALYVEEQ